MNSFHNGAYPATYGAPAYGAQWRPVPLAPRMSGAQVARPRLVASSRVGQAREVARGADLVFGVMTGIAALVGGIAIATIVGGGDPKSTPPKAARPTWRYIGATAAVLGGIKLFIDFAKASGGSATTPTA